MVIKAPNTFMQKLIDGIVLQLMMVALVRQCLFFSKIKMKKAQLLLLCFHGGGGIFFDPS